MARTPVGFVLVLIFTFSIHGITGNEYLTNKVKQTIQDIVGHMCKGIPSLNIPKLEPFVKNDNVDISFNNSMGTVAGGVSNIRIEGISSLKVNFLNMETTSFNFAVEIPKVSLKGKFKASGVISDMFPINGQGDFDFEVTSIKLQAAASIIQVGEFMRLTKLIVQPSISKLKGQIQNLVANEKVNKFLNDALNDIGPQLLQDMWSDYGNMIISEFEKNQQKYLKPITHSEFLLFLAFGPQIVNKDSPANCRPHILN